MSTTYDGQQIAREAPFGATVVVYRIAKENAEFLVLHRAHNGPDYDGEVVVGVMDGLSSSMPGADC